MNAFDVVTVVLRAVTVVAEMVARGVSANTALERINKLDTRAAQVDADVNETMRGGK